MNKPTLYILCGLPFSGKSTVAKKLIDRFGFAYISLDQINADRGVGLEIEKTPITPQEWKETYAESYRNTEKLLKEGKSVIYDATNFTREQRDKLRAISTTCESQSKVIYVDIPASESRRRWQTNRESRSRFDVREEDFAEVFNNFQPPTPDESVVIYNQQVDLEDWIKTHFIEYDSMIGTVL